MEDGTAEWEILNLTALYIDKAKLAHVLRNIVTNAINFSPQGAVVTVKSVKNIRRHIDTDIIIILLK